MSEKETRIERKFVFGKHNKENIEKFLLVNNFKKVYPDRKINTIYLDTENFDNVRDNINGVSNRKKLRVRWYNDNLDKMYIEIKNKKNFNVWKNVEKINLKTNEKNLIEDLKKNFFNIKFKNNNDFNYKFVLKTNYKRSYWLSNNNKIRATIDIDINASSLNNFSKPVHLGDTVLEFKFNPIHEKHFRDFFSNKFNHLRIQKYSKYVRSFLELENSGINC